MIQNERDKLEGLIAETKDKVARQDYQNGLNTAWEYARMLIDISTYMEGADILDKVFGKASLIHIFENYSAAEVIAKFGENVFDYINSPAELPKKGDEIEKDDGQIGVIVDVNDITEKANVLWASGNVSHALDFKRFKLTGRNFSEVIGLLDKMVFGEM
jgi:hypothetical protein